MSKLKTTLLNLNNAVKSYNQMQNNMLQQTQAMNAANAQNMQYAIQSQEMANAYNANQAQINRDFQEYMSNTAHQREVRDLQAAGLSPVLSANAGATTPGGAMAQTSDNLTSVFGNMANTALNAMSNMTMAMANNSAQMVNTAQSGNISKYAADLASRTSLSINQAQMQMQKYVADIQSMTQQQVARIAGEYNLSAAQVHAFANKYAAEMAYDASIYGSKAGMLNVKRQNSTTMQAVKANNEQSAMNTTGTILGNLAGSIIGSVLGFAGARSPRTSFSYVGQI